MSDLRQRLIETLTESQGVLSSISESEASFKSHPAKWSRKEILGHLVDSAINNLQRFTEVQFKTKPYQMRGYNQDALVTSNNYQNDNFQNITALWIAINNRIAMVMEHQTEESLGFKIKTLDGGLVDLQYLMTDYIDHMRHHLRQIEEYQK